MSQGRRLLLAGLIAAALAVSLLPAVGIGASTPPSVRAVGNRLVVGSGEAVRLLGVNRSGSEFKCIQGGSPSSRGWGLFDGPTDLSSAQAIAGWHANTVRVPLNEDCWLGLNGVNPAWSGTAYRQQVAALVGTFNTAGLYVILDLHWNAPDRFPALAQQPMPDADHSIQFWRSVAETFRDNQSVVFDLYNEPFLYGSYMSDPGQDPWKCWRDGCRLNQHLTGSGNPYTLPGNWQVAGMQTLVKAVRDTGAHNLVMVAGLDWANDLSGWLAHQPQDPDGNLAISWHSYPRQGCSPRACWETLVAAAAAKYPIIVGETGDNVCQSPDYVPGFAPWADAHGLSYLGWTWNTWSDCANVLIKDYRGTPTAGYGTYFHDHLAALAKSPVQPVANRGPASKPGNGAVPHSVPAAASRFTDQMVGWRGRLLVVASMLALLSLLGVVALGLRHHLRAGRR